MNNIIKKSSFGKITFVFLSFSILLGFYFSEDASGGGSAAAISRRNGRWWAVPTGIVTGAMIACDIDGGYGGGA